MQDDEISCYVARPMNECTKMSPVLPLLFGMSIFF